MINFGVNDCIGAGIKIIPTSDVVPGCKRVDGSVNYLVHPEEYTRMQFMTAREILVYLSSLENEFETEISNQI